MIMREIKFRGQTRKLGEKVNLKGEPVPSNWVYGGIFQGVERSVIYDGETYEKHTVYNETVGQYTGLKDKNGREVYEGDIESDENGNLSVVCYLERYGAYCFVPTELYKHEDYAKKIRYHFGYDCYFHNAIPSKYSEVIGNIHENPELLGDSK